ncbi:MAG: portal protein, partial [Candidatus Nezhaarchaeales archaeon]
MARKSKETILNELHAEAIQRFTEIQDREQSQRSLAIEDALFAHSEDGMWGERETSSRKDRPRYTINRVSPAIDQICGDQKQNRTSIKVRAADGEASKDVAKVYDGLIRSIESLSQAENCYDGAFEEAVTGGYGGWRLNTEYANEESFDQDIRIRPIKSAASSLYFGPSIEYDKRDAPYAFYTSYISDEEFKKTYPKAKAGAVDFDQETYNDGLDWYREGLVRLCEYWVKTPTKKKIARLSDGRTIDMDEDGAILDELAFEGITVEKTRTVDSYKIEMYIMSGSEILKGPQAWA